MTDQLIFYDGACGLCDQVVRFVLEKDKKNQFVFAPLQGITAQKIPFPRHEDTVVLIENYGTPNQHTYILGKAALRILWLLGGVWAVPGLFSFLPSWCYDWAYRLVARNRHRLFPTDRCIVPPRAHHDRFLP
jgi:predicted DCC family thiol-disulfide oxidoreductase YuxK